MKNIIMASITITTLCTAQGRPRPHARPLPQERRARPWFQISPRHEDSVGQFVSSRWKWPLYQEDGFWKQGLRGEWIWRESNISKAPSRWKPVETKKPTNHLPQTGKKLFKHVKNFGPKYISHNKNYNVKSKKITNRIDKSSPDKNFHRSHVNHVKPVGSIDKKKRTSSINTNRPLKLNNYLNGDSKQTNVDNLAPHLHNKEEVFNIISKEDTLIADKEVDGRKIYMFKGNEGIGSFKYNQIHPSIKPIITSNHKNQLIHVTDKIIDSTVDPPLLKTTTFASVDVGMASSSISSTPPPFPTRHTTSRASHHKYPIIIISQSSVMQNY